MAVFPSAGATIKGRVLASFPVAVEGTGGIQVTKENGVWTIEPKWDDLALIDTDSEVVNKQAWVYDDATGVYNRIRLPLIFGGAVRYDEEQNITDAERLQARQNIRAARETWRDVFDHDATGDGVADETAAFTAASVAANTDGGIVFIPATDDGYHFEGALTGLKGPFLPDPGLSWTKLTDAGNFTLRRGKTTGGANGANIWRFADRVFIGGAASEFAGNSSSGDEGNSWFSDHVTYPAYLGINAHLLVVSEDNPYGIVSAVKTSKAANHGIAIGAAIDADEASKFGWGIIAEVTRQAGAQSVYGMEIAAKNNGSNGVMTPNMTPHGVYGLWLAGGGAQEFGGVGLNPSTAAVVILANDHTWNSGIMFRKDALTNGEAIAMSSEGDGGAHTMRWYNAAGNIVFNVRSSASDTVQWLLDRDNTGLRVNVGGKNLFLIATPGSAVNGLTAMASATGNAVQLQATGDDTNINLKLAPKGAGLVLGIAPNRAYAEYVTNADITTQIPNDDTIPQNTEGDEILSASITPKSATSRLRIRFQGQGSLSGTGESAYALFQDSTAGALTATVVQHSGAGWEVSAGLEYEMVSGTTSATTFKIRAGPTSAVTLRMNGTTASRAFGGVSRCTLVVEEIPTA